MGKASKASTTSLAVNHLCRYNEYFPCSRCLKLRLGNDFGDKQREPKRGKGNIESNRRFCLGAKDMLYQPGLMIETNERNYFPCALCLRIVRSGLYCITCCGCQRCLESHMIRGNTCLGITAGPDHVQANVFVVDVVVTW